MANWTAFFAVMCIASFVTTSLASPTQGQTKDKGNLIQNGLDAVKNGFLILVSSYLDFADNIAKKFDFGI
ncbi:hypothetical protein RRG08_064276 [Elysia crispata]|uniref:Uncharacterized protein n=1 Tax=Elysia crispata TaxID=231223 RepID=A0AAE0YQ17_9GAST|nr:hypothetical protein RRG08_064276 [Elysia crispata]